MTSPYFGQPLVALLLDHVRLGELAGPLVRDPDHRDLKTGIRQWYHAWCHEASTVR